MRTKRTNGSTTYTYVYNGGNLSQMTVDGHTLRFSYDAQGPMFVKYDTLTYQYILNLQGDVIGIMDPYGSVVVQYTYDAWGNILSTTGSMASTLGKYNPLRYRSYVFDPETELYYLQTRYYNPEWGRFINADVFVSTGQGMLGNNMFAYCTNNPVNYFDPTGLCGLCLSNNTKGPNFFAVECDGNSAGGGILIPPTIFDLAEDTAEIIIAAVATISAAVRRGTQHVYILTDPDENNIVKYVGRTNNPDRRRVEHRTDPKHPERHNYELSVIASGLTIREARLLEQVLISAFTLGYLENARREIAVGKIDKYHQYLGAVVEIFNGVTEDGLIALLGR